MTQTSQTQEAEQPSAVSLLKVIHLGSIHVYTRPWEWEKVESYMHTYTQEASDSNEEDANDVYLVSYLSNLLHHALIIC